jgi:hypothetical protein
MAVFSGTAILNTGGTAADNPPTSPILTVANVSAQVVGFAFTNPSTSPIIVSIYRNSVLPANLLFSVTVLALAGMTGGPAIQTQSWGLNLAIGEMIYAAASPIGGYVNVEIDGLSAGSTVQMTTNQLLLAQMLMWNQISGVDIPDVNQLAALGYNM